MILIYDIFRKTTIRCSTIQINHFTSRNVRYSVEVMSGQIAKHWWRHLTSGTYIQTIRHMTVN